MLERLFFLYGKYPLDLITHLISSLPILVSLFRYKYLPLPIKLVTLFFLFSFFKESYATWLAIHKKSNLHLQNIETIIETGILLAIALSCFKQTIWRRFASILAIISISVSLLTYQSDAISTASLSTFRLFAIFFCLSYFNKILSEVRIKNILVHSLFWFTTGLLIYSAGTFFIVLFSEYWYKDINKVPAEVFDKYWNVSQILFIIFSVTSAIGIWFSKYDRENVL